MKHSVYSFTLVFFFFFPKINALTYTPNPNEYVATKEVKELCSKLDQITTSGLANIACTDTDAIVFQLNPTGTGLGATYNINVSGGGATSILPTSGTYGIATTFTLNNNSAGSGDVTITITDADDITCTLDVVVADPGACSPLSCNCKTFVYLNEQIEDQIYKFRLENDGTFTEVTNPWHSINNPHGGTVDQNGYIWVSARGGTNPGHVRLDCDGNEVTGV